MCGISGIFNIEFEALNEPTKKIEVMNKLQEHRGPDEEGVWIHNNKYIGLGHKRLSIIDLSSGKQPMTDESGNWIVYNGEIYNYIELRHEIGISDFKTTSDTEVILKSYNKWGYDCLSRFRGMFSFVIWDNKNKNLFCARDRFGIKPLYYTLVKNIFYIASEAKALLPFIPEIKTNYNALKDYLVFQFVLQDKTLFEYINQLPPAHFLLIKKGKIITKKYWEIYYNIDLNHTEKYFIQNLKCILQESVDLHLRSDVALGAYISGGTDSSTLAGIASGLKNELIGFTGKFSGYGDEFNEVKYARDLSKKYELKLYEKDINFEDFLANIEKIIYHLDYPVAGPGSFPQYMISKLAAEKRKVVIGGQGGDEIFGGYMRYLIAYFEQCIKGAIEGTLYNGNFVVTYESIISNLGYLENYKPLLQSFFAEGMFEPLGQRYFRLINRATTLNEEINWNLLENGYSTKDSFLDIFYGDNINKQAYFDSMTHFDFKTLLPALLHVEDRMSMAHGLESRVPFLDHKLVEFAATIPADIKFKNGKPKRVLLKTVQEYLPQSIVNRKNKMGFPVPIDIWFKTNLQEYIYDTFNFQKNKNREEFNTNKILESIEKEPKFGRKIWGLLSLEIWHQTFHDKEHYYKSLIN